MPLNTGYFSAYRSPKLRRDTEGVLVVEFHSNGGPCTFSPLHHTEVGAFHRIAQLPSSNFGRYDPKCRESFAQKNRAAVEAAARGTEP